MRTLVMLLMLGLVAFSGCLSDDEPVDDEPVEEEAMEEEAMEPETEDFGEYVLEIATGHCHASAYDEVVPGQVYQSAYAGGTWVFQESNGVPGLQYSDNHPGSGTGAGFELGVDSRCMDGDQVLV